VVVLGTQLGQDTLEVQEPGSQHVVLFLQVGDASEAVGGLVVACSASLSTCRTRGAMAVTLFDRSERSATVSGGQIGLRSPCSYAAGMQGMPQL